MNFDGLFSLFCLYETEIMTFFAGQTMEKTATKRRNYKKYAIYGTIILAAGFLLLRLFGQSEPISYITEPVKRQDIEKVVNAAGEVRASELVTIGAQVSGKIEKLYVSVGQNVKKGDMIAEIDSTTQQNEVDSTKAKLKSYQAQLTAAQITEKVAQQQYDRTKKLAEQKAASAEDLENAEDVLLRGRDVRTGKPATVSVSPKDVNKAILPPLQTLLENIREAFENTPPELAADILERGVSLSGGGARLEGLRERLSELLSMPVHMSGSPEDDVAAGAGAIAADERLAFRLRKSGCLIEL